MKTIRYVVLIALIVFGSVPLFIAAQDDDDDPPVIDVHPATPGNGIPTEELIEYPSLPTATLDIHPATPGNGIPTEELIEYPFTPEATDPCAPSPEEIEADIIIPPIPGDPCFPTVTPSTIPPLPTEMPAITNGLWIQKSSDYSISGSCQIPPGDNDGPPNYGSEDEIPRIPACVSFDNRWLMINSNTMMQTAPGVYSETSHVREVKLDNNGKSVGSVNITITREYIVISPTEVGFRYIREEEGGCTTVSSIRYQLVEPNELVCSGTLITPMPTTTPAPTSTPAPGTTLQPTIVPEPFRTGGYRIEFPQNDPACTPEKLPPSNEVNVSYTANQDVMIDFGLGSYTLYWDGDDYYSYQEGILFDMSILVTEDGRPYFTWSKRLEPGDDSCFVSSELVSKDAPPPTGTPTPEPTSVPDVEASTIAGSSFTTMADITEQMCPAEAASSLPDLSTATLTAQADDTFLFSLDGQDYILTNVDGIYGYQEIHDDGSVLQVSMNGFYNGLASGSFALVGSEGYCIAMLTFTPA